MKSSCIAPPAESLIPSVHDLLTAEPERFVARFPDIAAVNLACARGLPNADESEFPEYLALLDTIADAVRRETERSWRFFKLKPAQFHHSENVFRIYTMEHVFRVRFGIKYDPLVHALVEREGNWRTSDSSEIFIHGILSAKRTGTCSSLPTFAIAVGRRLGYPLKLVLVPNHTLYRWDDGDEVFNFQHTEAGGDVRPDEYFYTWPIKWEAIHYEINRRTGVWLHSLRPAQEVSKFLCNRALLLRDIGRFGEALQALAAAERFNPKNPACGDIRGDILCLALVRRGLAMAALGHPLLPSTAVQQWPLTAPPVPGMPHRSPTAAPAPSMPPMPAPIPFGPMEFFIDAVRQDLYIQAAELISQGIVPKHLHAHTRGGRGLTRKQTGTFCSSKEPQQ